MFVYDDHIQQFNKFQREAFLSLMHYLPDTPTRKSAYDMAVIDQWAYMLHGRCEAFLPMYDAHYIAERLHPLTISNSIGIIPIIRDRQLLIDSCTPGPRSKDLTDRVDSWCIYGGKVDCFYTGDIPDDSRGPMAVITKAFSNSEAIEFRIPHLTMSKPIVHKKAYYFIYIYVSPKMK